MENLSRIMSKMFRLVGEFMNYELKDLELSSGIAPFLRAIGEKENQTMKELSDGVDTDLGYTSRSIQKLVDLGYIVKNKDPIDKRVCRVNLTEKGNEAIKKIKETLKKWYDILSENVTHEEITYMEQTMEKFYNNVLKFFNTVIRGGKRDDERQQR